MPKSSETYGNFEKSSEISANFPKLRKRFKPFFKEFKRFIVLTARFSSKWRNMTVIQCYAPTNSNEEEIKEEFYEELQAVMNKESSRDIAIVMGDMNAKVGCENTGIETVIGQQGAKCKMNENGELLIDFCATNKLVIEGTLFPHKECHKATWVSPVGKTQNQIDHLAISHRWKSSLQGKTLARPPLSN